MTPLTSLVMSPVFAEKPWGGRRLAAFGKALPDGMLIGESWEVADLPSEAVAGVPDPRSRVGSGPHAGKTLHELIGEYGPDLLGSVAPTAEGRFPLLVKLLDAHEHLSVQVHPDVDYVRDHPTARLKTESWYVVASDPGAHLYLGLRAGVTVEDVARRVGTAGIVGLLKVVAAVPGDFHHLPAGLVHALGAGVMVAEVQTPSDTTFRLYDWEDRYDRAHRPMHGAAALQAIRPRLSSDHSSPPAGPGTRRLSEGEYYSITEHRCAGGAVEIDRSPEVRIVMIIAGDAVIDGYPANAGTTVVLPATIAPAASIAAARGAILLEIGLA